VTVFAPSFVTHVPPSNHISTHSQRVLPVQMMGGQVCAESYGGWYIKALTADQ